MPSNFLISSDPLRSFNAQQLAIESAHDPIIRLRRIATFGKMALY
jgi:hypothetical protein